MLANFLVFAPIVCIFAYCTWKNKFHGCAALLVTSILLVGSAYQTYYGENSSEKSAVSDCPVIDATLPAKPTAKVQPE